MQKITAVPEFKIFAGPIASQIRPGGTMSVRLIVPTKPFNEPMMTLELADDPTFEGAGDGAVMVKSLKLKVGVAECDRRLLSPVIVSV